MRAWSRLEPASSRRSSAPRGDDRQWFDRPYCDVWGFALDAVPLWAPAECALRWPWRRTEEVPCGTDVMMSTYAHTISTSIFRTLDTLTTIAQLPETCRAEASSMPEGPAVSRVEAERRALTMPSTAPASNARWRIVRDCPGRSGISSRNNNDAHKSIAVRLIDGLFEQNPDPRTRT